MRYLSVCVLLFSIRLASGQTPEAKNDVVDEKTIHALIAQLGDDSFVRREAAQKRLAAIGLPAYKLLRRAAKENADLELRERASRLVQDIGQVLFRPSLSDKDWGDSVDPDGDCKFRVDTGELRIKIPGTPHRLGIELGSTNGPRVLRSVEGDFHVQVKVLGAFPSANRSLVGKYPWYGAGLLIWQDEKNYIRLERARMDFSSENTRCYTNWELRSGAQFTRKGTVEDGALDEDLPAFFRISRQGNSFAAAFSQDGKDWKELQPITAELVRKVRVGVAAVQNTAAGYDAVFEELKITPGKK
jgi:regulation of enolase protein 1 (concanavalin A-like superfamily)